MSDVIKGLLPLFVQYVLPLLATGLFSLVIWALNSARKAYEAQKDHTLASSILYRVEALALMVVTDLEQTLKPLLAKDTATGQLTVQAQNEIKHAAVEKLKSYISADGLQKLISVLGFNAHVEDFLGTAVEHAVAKVNASTSSVGVPGITPTAADAAKDVPAALASLSPSAQAVNPAGPR